MLARVLHAPSPFYEERLRRARIEDPEQIPPGSLSRLPLTRRDEMVRDQLDHLPHGSRRFADAGLPVRAGISGSGKSLLVLLWSAADLEREREAGARLLGRLGVGAGMRVANTLPGALTTPGSLLLGDVVETIGGLDVPLGSIDSEAGARQAWDLIDRVQPAVAILERPSAGRLFAAVPPGERPWWAGIVWLQRAAETAPAPAVPAAAGFAGWQRTWLAVPEATSFVAHSCAAARFHIDDELVAEVVDEQGGTLVGDGAPGSLALTPLGGDTALLRYASGLRARAVVWCSCGEPGMAVELIGC